VRDLAAGLDHACGHVRVIAEGDAAFLDVWTGDIDLDGIDGGIVETSRNLDVFLQRGTGDIGDKAGLGEIQCRQYRRDDMIDARVLQADGIQHPHGSFGDAVGRIAETWVERGSLETHGADIPVGKACYACVFFPETDTTGEQHQWRGKGQATKIHLQWFLLGFSQWGHRC
jgi:hypothetical protein